MRIPTLRTAINMWLLKAELIDDLTIEDIRKQLDFIKGLDAYRQKNGLTLRGNALKVRRERLRFIKKWKEKHLQQLELPLDI